MTFTRIVTLLSVIALLASLPLTVALAQGAPFAVVGSATVDGDPAAMGTTVVAMTGEGDDAMMWMGDVFNDAGQFTIQIPDGEEDAMLSFMLKMGEGDEAMEYMAKSDQDAMIGSSGDRTDLLMLMAYTSEDAKPEPTAVPAPTKTEAQKMDAMRGAKGAKGDQGDPGVQGEQGPQGSQGNRGPAGADGAPGDAGGAGAAGAKGAAGDDGAAGKDGSDGSKGSSGDAGPAGPPGDKGDTGEAGASGGGILAIIALIIAIVGVLAAGGAFIAGRNSG